MDDKLKEYPYPQKGTRQAPDTREMNIFVKSAVHEGGSKRIATPAKKFASRFSTTVTRYPKSQELPKWFRAMIEKKVSTEELAKTLHDRLHRAPSEENQEFALIVANEIARMKGGAEVLAKYATPELLARLSVKGGEK